METDVVSVIFKITENRISKKPLTEITTEELTFLALMEILKALQPEQEEPKEKKVAVRVT